MGTPRTVPVFVDWMHHVLVSGLDAHSKLVCYVIRSDGRGSWPSLDRIAELGSMSRKQVQRSLNKIELAGLLTRKRRFNADGRQVSNLYHPLIPQGEGDSQSPPEGLTVPPEGDSQSPELVQRNQSPSLRSGEGLPGWVDPDVWKEWLKARKAAGAKGTEYALQLNIKTLERLKAQGHDPSAVMEQSIEHGWKGLFPVKEETNAASRNGRKLSAVERAELAERRGDARDAELSRQGHASSVDEDDADLREPLDGSLWRCH